MMNSPLDDLDEEQKTKLLAHISRAEVTHGLGNFVMEFQLLETLIKDAISFLINKNDSIPGRIVTAEMSFRTLLDVLVALFHYETRDESRTEVLKTALTQSQKASDRRNALVRSYWHTDQDGGTVRLKMRAKGRQPYREVEERDNLGAALEVDLRQCQEAFRHLATVLNEQFPGWTAAEIPSE
jgi:hypothetical protein